MTLATIVSGLDLEGIDCKKLHEALKRDVRFKLSLIFNCAIRESETVLSRKFTSGLQQLKLPLVRLQSINKQV